MVVNVCWRGGIPHDRSAAAAASRPRRRSLPLSIRMELTASIGMVCRAVHWPCGCGLGVTRPVAADCGPGADGVGRRDRERVGRAVGEPRDRRARGGRAAGHDGRGLGHAVDVGGDRVTRDGAAVAGRCAPVDGGGGVTWTRPDLVGTPGGACRRRTEDHRGHQPGVLAPVWTLAAGVAPAAGSDWSSASISMSLAGETSLRTGNRSRRRGRRRNRSPRRSRLPAHWPPR